MQVVRMDPRLLPKGPRQKEPVIYMIRPVIRISVGGNILGVKGEW